jgi:heme/copper-type cytochrome/quinol oxidase subunit 2
MGNRNDNNYISVGSWMWMLFVTAIPVIGLIMIFVWAFTGDNESRKNYYRAILIWVLVIVLLYVGLIVFVGLGISWPVIQQHLHHLSNKS